MLISEKIKKISIDSTVNILFALKQMDKTRRRLLLVFNESKFIGLLSIGDIQRAIIAWDGTNFVNVGGGTAGGSNTQVQYNSSGVFAGSANFTFNGTTATVNTLNLTNALGIGYGGTGQVTAGAAFNALSPITTTGDLILGNGTNSATRLGIGTSGYVLTAGATTASWQPASGAVASGAIYTNTTTISSNYTISSGNNGFSVGPITISSGYAVTVATGQRWVIL